VPADLPQLRRDPAAVVDTRTPGWREVFAARDWHMLADIERVYVNAHARESLSWKPQYDFARAINDLQHGRDHRSELTRLIGAKGYHNQDYPDGIYPVTG
jgi:UDP-glucose 4-epimerase